MFNFTNALPVVSNARKLIFAVKAGGPVVLFPEGVTISGYGQNNLTPAIVVHNRVDVKDDPRGTWQGADAKDGVVILNAVTESVALELLELAQAGVSLESILEAAAEKGAVDQYTTSKTFVDTKLSPAGRMIEPYTGIVKRDDRDICYVGRDAAGNIWRKMGDNVRHIDTNEILVRDYVQANGSPIDPSTIPVLADEAETVTA